MKDKQNIRQLSEIDLNKEFETLGQPKFRVRQLNEWLWQKHITQFSEMSNLPIDLRSKLEEKFDTFPVTVEQKQVSSDGTIKFAFKLWDGHFVEGVLIPSGKRMTACISSQVGCSLTCSFCATGTIKLKRNINFDEIFDQVAIINKTAIEQYDGHLSNIVYMGMGEPLLNFSHVIQSIEKICSPLGLGMSPSRITVSTAGIAKMMKKIADIDAKFNLALSLHAANDEKRNRIMPINESNALQALKDALKYYHEKTGNRIFIEYIMLSQFNDSLEDANELINFCKNFPVKINLIEYNTVEGAEFKGSAPGKITDFINVLEKNKLIVNLRHSRGKDIDAACGQLANKSVSN